MMILFSVLRVLYIHFVEHGHTVTIVYFIDLLKKMLTHFCRKWSHKRVEEILRCHDNAQPHVAMVAIKFNTNLSTNDMSDFFQFSFYPF